MYTPRTDRPRREAIGWIRGKDWLLAPLDTYASTHNWTSKVDRANRQVIDYVLYGKRQQTVQDILNRSFEELRKQIAGSTG